MLCVTHPKLAAPTDILSAPRAAPPGHLLEPGPRPVRRVYGAGTRALVHANPPPFPRAAVASLSYVLLLTFAPCLLRKVTDVLP